MHLFHIPQCTIQNRNVHISVLNGALWDMEQVHCGICEIGLLWPWGTPPWHQRTGPPLVVSTCQLMWEKPSSLFGTNPKYIGSINRIVKKIYRNLVDNSMDTHGITYEFTQITLMQFVLQTIVTLVSRMTSLLTNFTTRVTAAHQLGKKIQFTSSLQLL